MASRMEEQLNLIDCETCAKLFKDLQTAQQKLANHVQNCSKKKSKQQKALEMQRRQKTATRARLLELLQKTSKIQEIFCGILWFYDSNTIQNNLEYILSQLYNTLNPRIGCNLYVYGSAKLRMDIKGSDIDVYAKCNNVPPKNEISHFNACLNRAGSLLHRSDFFSNVFTVRHARVPIVRCQHTESGIYIDLNFHSLGGLYNTKLLNMLISRDMRIKQLMLFLKIWANENCIFQANSLTNHALTMLIIYSLMQIIPQQITGLQYNLEPILPSMEDMQNSLQPKISNGINYAFRFDLRILPPVVTTIHLIAHFLMS